MVRLLLAFCIDFLIFASLTLICLLFNWILGLSGLVISSLGDGAGGLTDGSNVTLCSCFARDKSSSWIGLLVSSYSSFCNASICSKPSTLFLPFNAHVRSLIALTIWSAGVTLGWVIYLCLNQTVSVIRSLLVFFTCITWHDNVLGMCVSTIL